MCKNISLCFETLRDSEKHSASRMQNFLLLKPVLQIYPPGVNGLNSSHLKFKSTGMLTVSSGKSLPTFWGFIMLPSLRFVNTRIIHFPLLLDCLTLKLKALRSFETPIILYYRKGVTFPKVLNIQQHGWQTLNLVSSLRLDLNHSPSKY